MERNTSFEVSVLTKKRIKMKSTLRVTEGTKENLKKNIILQLILRLNSIRFTQEEVRSKLAPILPEDLTEGFINANELDKLMEMIESDSRDIRMLFSLMKKE